MSQVAAEDALKKAFISRWFFSLPAFVSPIFFNFALSKINLLPKSGSKMRIFTEVLFVGTGLYFGMALNCSIYPQTVSIDIEKLEPDIQARAKARGVNTLYFNKGI